MAPSSGSTAVIPVSSRIGSSSTCSLVRKRVRRIRRAPLPLVRALHERQPALTDRAVSTIPGHPKTQNQGAPRPMEAAAPTDAAARAAEAQVPTNGQAPEKDFSMALNQGQKDIRDWVHGFADGVVRPAAAEWDEKEETPWPVIQEAAKIGLYGFEAIAQFWADETGLTLPIVNEELFWGDAGIGMSIMGTTLAVAGIFSAGTPDQMGEWIPQCFGTEQEPKVGAFCVSEPDAGSDVSSLRTRA